MAITLTIVYCVIAFILDHYTWKAWQQEKESGNANQEFIDSEGSLRVGVILGCLFWIITVPLGIIEGMRKK